MACPPALFDKLFKPCFASDPTSRPSFRDMLANLCVLNASMSGGLQPDARARGRLSLSPPSAATPRFASLLDGPVDGNYASHHSQLVTTTALLSGGSPMMESSHLAMRDPPVLRDMAEPSAAEPPGARQPSEIGNSPPGITVDGAFYSPFAMISQHLTYLAAQSTSTTDASSQVVTEV